jgi:hypothetical protein
MTLTNGFHDTVFREHYDNPGMESFKRQIAYVH